MQVQQPRQYRQPVIIHTFSPEVIQTDANDFMRLVQRLTGQAGHPSPLTKRPRLGLPPAAHQAQESLSHEQQPSPNWYNLASQQQRNMLELGFQHISSSSPQPQQNRLGPGLPPLPSPDLTNRLGLGFQAGPYSASSILSPSNFDFSPSLLPSPSTFLTDYAALVSPSAGALQSSRLAMGAARSPMISLPAVFPSPGPLTSAFLGELPLLSPAAYSWIEKHPLSADAMLSPLSKGFGLPPRPPPPHA